MRRGEPDLLVVGGGPAGLAVAIGARLAGLSATVLDRRRPPIDKPCGEGLMPDGVAALARLGVDRATLGGRPFRGIRYLDQSGDGEESVVAEGEFPGGFGGLGVRRTRLHAALVARAEEVGVDLRWGVAARRLVGDGERFAVATDAGPLAGRWLAGADGLRSPLRRWAGLEGRPPRRRRFGVRRHYRVAPWSDCVEVWWADRGEAYVTPVVADEVGVAMLWSPDEEARGFDDLLTAFPRLAARLAGAEVMSKDRGAGPLRQRPRAVRRGNLALLGDAAGYLDAITGEGLALAFHQAEALVAAIGRGDLGRYAAAHRRLCRLPDAITALLLAVERRPRLRRRTIRALAAEPALFSRLLGVHARSVPLSDFGMRGAMRLVWDWQGRESRKGVTMGLNVAQKLIRSHLVEGEMTPGVEIGLRIDQTLTQDATGTLVMLELEAMGLDRVETELSAQYVDHNLIQEDFKNPDDHLFLRSACRRFGLWYSRAGNGVSHPVHQERFGKPGKTLLGSDSHTPAAGAIGMLAIGAGGLEVALAMAGEPVYLECPEIWGVRLVGELPDWVSAKDVILEMLRRHDVAGGRGRIVEYYGPGLGSLSAMDRHVIANMGTELGATSTVFPADDEVRRFLAAQGREDDFTELLADPGAGYDVDEEIDLSTVEPLVALPSSPGKVVPVAEVAGREIYQSYVGSSANPGYRDFAVAAEMVKGRQVHDRVSFDVNPTSRQILINLTRDGHLGSLIAAGARIHQAGCNGCIGMGQAPATGRISLRTVPRNFPGRSGTREDQVYLVSPETAAASALTGEITDPRDLGARLGLAYPRIREPQRPLLLTDALTPPPAAAESSTVELVKGPNIASLPSFDPLPDRLELPVLLKVGDGVSTDEIMPAGARVLPFRSNIPEISRFCFDVVDESYHDRALAVRERGGHAVVGGGNYGQGSSREHAALAPRYLGLRAVLAKSFARIHGQNLVNFGILPLTFAAADDYQEVEPGDVLVLAGLRAAVAAGAAIEVENRTKGRTLTARHDLSPRQVEILLAGGLINWVKGRQGG